MESLSALFPFALILVAFYFLIIRPGRTRQRAAAALQERLAPGVEVLTTSGMFGRVASVTDDSVHGVVSPGTTIRFVKGAMASILAPDEVAPTDDVPPTDEVPPKDESRPDGPLS